MRVQLKPGASAVKAKPRRYDPVKMSWLASYVAALLAFGLVFRNLPAVGSIPAMAVPKQDSGRLVGDLLSRWVSVPALSVRAVTVFGPCDQDDLCNIVLMEPLEVCTAEATAASLLTWSKTLGCRVCS